MSRKNVCKLHLTKLLGISFQKNPNALTIHFKFTVVHYHTTISGSNLQCVLMNVKQSPEHGKPLVSTLSSATSSSTILSIFHFIDSNYFQKIGKMIF